MIWVIQKLVNNKWENHHAPNGMPMMFYTKRDAEKAIRGLDYNKTTYRAILVRD